MKKVKLYKTDFVLLKDGQPLESLDIIYNESSVKELFEDGFELEEGEEFVRMTDLSKELKEQYIKVIQEFN